MSQAVEKSEFTLMFPTGGATENVVEDNETQRGSILKVWPTPPEDATRCQWMRLIETSGAFEFWGHPDEDIYSDKDGEPV